jgi:hypothetical protein
VPDEELLPYLGYTPALTTFKCFIMKKIDTGIEQEQCHRGKIRPLIELKNNESELELFTTKR